MENDAPDKPPTGFITSVVVISFLFVFSCWFIAYPFLEQFASWQENRVDTGQGNKPRLDYLSQQNTILSSSKKLDDGFYQIPIDQAIKQVVEKQGSVFQKE